jgi:hypothetical protein
MRKLNRFSLKSPREASGSPLFKMGAFGCAAALAMSAAGCLPGDTRPVPERVDATVEPGPGLTNGIETADGWRISFERVLLATGNLDFENDDVTCNSYAEARYDRLFDFAVVTGRQKLGTAYGLGTCRVEFRLRAPSFDALLGPGATAEDVAMMRARATDRFAEEERVSLLAVGSAVKGEEAKRFEWVFRQSYEMTDCKAAEGDGFMTTLTLTEGASSELRIEVRPEELFRALPDDGAPLRFQPMADADADGDGRVTFDELSKMLRPVVATGELGPDGGAVDAGAVDGGAEASLEALVYKDLLPRVLRVAGGGSCEVDDRGSGR